MRKLYTLLMLMLSIVFAISAPNLAVAKDSPAINACALAALESAPFNPKDSMAVRLKQSRHQLPQTKLMINGVWTPLDSKFGATGECREALGQAQAANTATAPTLATLVSSNANLTTANQTLTNTNESLTKQVTDLTKERDAALANVTKLKQSNDAMGWLAFALGLGLVACIVLMGVYYLRSRKSAAKPERLSIHDLDNDSPDGDYDTLDNDTLGDDTINNNDSIQGGNDTINNDTLAGNGFENDSIDGNDTLGSSNDADRGEDTSAGERRDAA